MSRLFTSGDQNSISPSSEYSGLISLKIDWFYLIPVQGTLQSLLQNYSSKASILRHSAFFMVQLSQLHVTTGKTIALTIWTFVGRVVSLLFNTLSRFVVAFLPRSKSSDFMAAVTMHGDFRDHEEEICHYFRHSVIHIHIHIYVCVCVYSISYSFLSCLNFFISLLILFLAVLGLCCCTPAFSTCGEWGLLCVVTPHGLLAVVASLVGQRL